MMEDIAREQKREETTVKSIYDAIDFMTAFLEELSQLTGQISINAAQIFYQILHDRDEDLLNSRSKNHFSSRFKGRTPNPY